MNGQFCRVFLFLSLAILVLCLPAQAAHAGQSGSSSPMSDSNARFTVSSGFSATNPLESGEKASGMDTDRSVASQSLVQPGPSVMPSNEAQDPQDTSDKSVQTNMVNTNAGSSPLQGSSGDSSGRSDAGNSGHADAAGGTVYSQGTGGKVQPESPILRDNPENRGDWLV